MMANIVGCLAIDLIRFKQNRDEIEMLPKCACSAVPADLQTIQFVAFGVASAGQTVLGSLHSPSVGPFNGETRRGRLNHRWRSCCWIG